MTTKRSFIGYVFVALWTGLFLGVPMSWAAVSDGALRVEIVTAYNLVVDSNAGTPSSNAPRSAYMGITFHNDGGVPLTDVIARIGDYKGGAGDTPGIYPSRVHPGLTGPLAGGAFALTHEGGSAGLADATRYISSIPAGGAVTVYWLIGYPQLDINGVPTWGKSVGPEDDLWLQYDVWATAKEGAATRAVDVTRTVTFRNEISASANKIFPNGANKVPDYYKELMQQFVPSWTNANADGTVGTRIITEGIWYDLGNIGEGFDNNGDLVPDHNAWMQPVGDPSLFDPSAFRLVHTYAMVIVKLKTGGEQILTGSDQLYFENVPENNGAVGYVSYEFMPMLAGAQSMTSPYQEVASGRDNEKFNADYGVSLGQPLVSGEARVLIDKTASAATVSPGGSIAYTVAYTNSGTASAGNPEAGVPLVVQDAIPAGTVYVSGTATSNNTLPPGVSSYHVLYSTDGGATWSATQPSPATAVTHLQWWLDGPLAAGAAGAIKFSVTVANPYTRSNPQIPNVAGISFGNNTPFAYDDTLTLVLGNNTVGDTVYADTGVGAGGYLGNGLQDGTEPGLPGVTVWLYSDLNGNGTVEAGEPKVATTETGANGAYLFSNVADGRYVVVVDTADASLPNGYTVTTAPRVAVDLDSARANVNPVSVLTADFGFAPALVLTKARVGGGTLREGQNVTYLLTVTNNLVGDGSGIGKPATYIIFPTNGTSGTSGNKTFTNPSNLWRPGEPDSTYATAPYKDVSENVTVNGYYLGPQPGIPTNVTLRIPMRVNGGTFASGNTLQVIVRNNGTQIGAATLDCSTFSTGTYSLEITSYLSAWNWTNFNGSALSVELISKKSGNPSQTLDIDSVGFKVTTDQAVGASSGATTLDPVPLDDFFDPARLRFVSAAPQPDSVATNGGTGSLHWDNLGPIYAGGGRELYVTFAVLQPPGNVSAPLTNTVSVTDAYFLSGTPANDDLKKVTDTILPAGTIGDFVWRDLDKDGVQDAGEPGIKGVTVQLTPPAGVDLGAGTNQPITTVTDANGYYLFTGLPASGTFTVAVVTSTLPGGAGTPTYDRDGTNTANTAAVPLVYNSTTGADTVLDADFGYNLLSAIRGTLWHDRDRDGYPAPESGEELLGGVTVRLYASDGSTLLATTNTAADGTYQFIGAYNGSYVVKADAATGPLATGSWTRSYDTDGTGSANQVTVSVPLGGLGIADFSFYQTGTLAVGDTLFYDWNGNGVQDAATDTGIANVTVWLYQDENTNGVVDAGVDALVGVTASATNGFYSFTNLVQGTYLVLVDQSDPDFPALYLNTADPYGAKDGRSVVALTTANNWAQDFGYQPYGFNSIGDTVWRDLNADGVQSGASETGISNVTVRLYADLNNNGTYTQISAATTDANGKYLFASLPDGHYRVTVDTGSAGLPKDTFGSAYSPTTVTSYTPVVSGGQVYLSADFGFAPLGAIGDTIFWDSNANGGQDWNEDGIAGVTVRLYSDANANGVYDAGESLVSTKVTDANGAYLFTALPQGRYVVVVDASSTPLVGASLRADPEMDGAPCPTPPVAGPTCDGQTGVRILPGTAFMGADFGYQPLGVIGDYVWIDLNTNGVADAGEQGIPYVTVALYSGATLIATNATDADGYYSFSNLSNGTYRVSVVTNGLPAGLAASYDADHSADGTANNVVMSGGHVTSIGGSAVTNADLTIDFGYRYVGSNRLSGTVGLDVPTYDGLMNGSNPSGVGAGEYPFGEATVYLYLWHDANTNNVIGTGETMLIATTSTAANGDYGFSSLPSGSAGDRYVVSLAAPSGDLKLTTKTGDTAAQWVVNTTNSLGITLSAYQVVAIVPTRDNIDFAFQTTKVYDYGDLPESYSTVVGDNPIGPSHSVVTNVNLWLGSGLSTELNGKPSAKATGDDFDDGVIAVGRWHDGAAGGAVAVTVGAGSGWLEAWVDLNQDGTFTNANERVISRAVSSTNGGIYNLTFDIPDGTFRKDGATVLNARFRLYPSEPLIPTYFGAATGGEVEDYQFVFGIIGNYVWEDRNGNGVQDAGEPGVSNVTVRLYDAATNLLQTTTTAGDGSYVFTGLPTNSYSVVFAKPDGTRFTLTGSGGNAQLDSDPNASGAGVAVSLAASADRRDIDAGLYVPARLFGYLFVDRNGDLLRNSGDASITNALVWLMANGVAVASTNTSAQGYYFFDNVPVGTVSVVVSRASATLVNVPGADPAASDVTRNRGLPKANEEAYIAYSVVSGYGVLDNPLAAGSGEYAKQSGEPLNFGFSSYPLSTALDISVHASGSGGVSIDVWTVNEAGHGDIVVYAWINNAWVEVARKPGGEIVGEGSNHYTLNATGLDPDGAYRFKIVDEAGHVHYSDGQIEVRTIRVEAVRMNMQTLMLTFNTEPGRNYVVEVSTDLVNWENEYVSFPTAHGRSDFDNMPFTAAAAQVQVLVPVNGRKQAFFRVVMVGAGQ